MTRSYVSSHMERENPRDTCTFASFAPTVCRKNFFFKFQNRYIFHRDERMYKLSISIRSRYFDEEEKKEIERDYSFARKENRFKLIRRFALWMQQFYISFDKI